MLGRGYCVEAGICRGADTSSARQCPGRAIRRSFVRDGRRDIIVIGASAGGVEALAALARQLPADLGAAILVVLHLAAGHKSVLPRILGSAGPLPAKHTRNGEAIVPNRIYVARPDHHLLVHDGHGLALVQDPNDARVALRLPGLRRGAQRGARRGPAPLPLPGGARLRARGPVSTAEHADGGGALGGPGGAGLAAPSDGSARAGAGPG
ncbi:MAG TPA: chemotaxis protein CheB [Myxococcales bacterium]|nr:chemotaxis protein CheB [Myxococcales bacterium]